LPKWLVDRRWRCVRRRDTIDGSPGEVKIGRRRSKTFISDGLDNRITISQT
jgi:hypothetical protein